MSVANKNSSQQSSPASTDNRHKLTRLKSVQRITHLPVVESVADYYDKLKKSNTLLKWGLKPAEFGVWIAVESTVPLVTLLEKPVNAVDFLVCRSLDVIEKNIPVITYPPDVMYSVTKDYVQTKVVQPVLKRADSVKQIGISSANKCGEMAATKLNNALDVADTYVDKYLPDLSDTQDPNEPASLEGESKATRTILHVNQFGRKLQRRLTRRTIAEAKALKQQGADTLQCLLYLADLLARDPKTFLEQTQAMWAQLSQDEPENQVPPANLEQLIAMLTREMARRIVHLTNYTAGKIVFVSHLTVHTAQVTAINILYWMDNFLKSLHLEFVSEATASQLVKVQGVSIAMLEKLLAYIRTLKIAKQNKPAIMELSTSPHQQQQQQSLNSPGHSNEQQRSQPTSPTSDTEYNYAHDQ